MLAMQAQGTSRVPVYARVALDISTRALGDLFDYRVPPSITSEAKVGCAVYVEFGARPAVAYIVELANSTNVPEESIKDILAVLSEPYFDEAHAKLAMWVAREYVSPLSDAVRLLTPPGPSPKVVRTSASGKGPTWELRRDGLTGVEDNWVRITDSGRVYAPKPNAKLQVAVLEALKDSEMRVSELCAFLGGSARSAIAALSKRDAVEVFARRKIRGSESPALRESDAPRDLTPAQANALELIVDGIDARDGRVIVLDGVTGSGKTEVYLRACAHALASGGGALILVPEISLTPQTVGRVRGRFEDDVSVLHSKLSPGERFDQWDLLKRGEAHIAVGARSALFAPVGDLQLIVIDEEHEDTYKQESSPRYSAIVTARELARLTGAALVLGSATPSIETLCMCESGEWERATLPERPCGMPLPKVTIVDLAHEFEIGNKSMFSPALVDALCTAMRRDEKAILLYNRRGFARFLLCRECGFVPRCDDCSVSLTHHEGDSGASPLLVCHNCGRIYPVPPRCPSCNSPYLRRVGKGTEQAQAQLSSLFEMALGAEGITVPIIRMDADTVKAKGAHAALLSQFQRPGRAVLLGTQMIAKGLDFPEVTVAAVLNADTSLNLPDYRAAERTYELIEQLAGRAGRGNSPGNVIVQTYWPDHPAVLAAAAHDRSIFLDHELSERKGLCYPPYCRLANIRLWGRQATSVRDCANELAGIARQALQIAMGNPANDTQGWEMLGPVPCLIERSRGAWQWHIVVKAPKGSDLPGALGYALRKFKAAKGVSLAVDMDPVNLF